MINMENTGTDQVRLELSVPSRGLLGYSTQFMSQTRGYGIMNHSFSHYGPVVDGLLAGRRTGALVSLEAGKATAYGILNLEDRGTIFVDSGTEVYLGMVDSVNKRENDINMTIESH